jgi:hypothetical protein
VSGQHPPISCADFKAILTELGFERRNRKKQTSGSHEDWIGNTGGRFRKVTVDCPKAPFTHDLIGSMANQAGVTRKQIYDLYFGRHKSPAK